MQGHTNDGTEEKDSGFPLKTGGKDRGGPTGRTEGSGGKDRGVWREGQRGQGMTEGGRREGQRGPTGRTEGSDGDDRGV